MVTMKLSEKEAFLIFSIRKGYARCEDAIYSLAGLPETEEDINTFLECQDEREHKQRDIDIYVSSCKGKNKPIDLRTIDSISKRWDAEIAESQRKTLERQSRCEAHYQEFLDTFNVTVLATQSR